MAAGEAAASLGVRRLPAILVSAGAPAPLSLGLLHPVIVLPKSLPGEIDSQQLKAVLVHEAAHIFHRHHWIGLAQCLAGIMFWWNPLLNRINKSILQLREQICDDQVLQTQENGYQFAQILVKLAGHMAGLPRVPATIAILETPAGDFQRELFDFLIRSIKS